MDWVWYLFSFKGRINRAKLWLAALIIICWMIFLGVLAVVMTRLLASGGTLHIDFGIECIVRIFNPAFYRSHPLKELPMRLFEAAATLLFLWVYFANLDQAPARPRQERLVGDPARRDATLL